MPMNSAWLEACSALDCVNSTTIHDITAVVARRHGCTLAEIRGMSREVDLCWARWEAWHLCKRGGYSAPRIAHYFSDRDHTTILHGIKKWRAFNASNRAAA